MKQIAIGILFVVFLSILIEPLVEISNVMREKIILGSALSNACRAAKDRSLEYERQRNRDAEINEETFKDYFSEAFAEAMNLTRTSTVGNTLKFTSNDGKYNDFLVEVNFNKNTDYSTDLSVSSVHVKADSPYMFKTKYLKMAESSAGGVGYDLTSERMLLLRIRN